MSLKNKNSGNIIFIAIVLSALIMGFGITVTSVMTLSIVSVRNITKASVAYYDSEAGAENGYYLFAGHLPGFEYNYDNDSACEVESGEDKWCLKSRLNNIPDTTDSYETLNDNGVISIGLYNDTSATPYGTISTSNVDLSHHLITISLYPAPGADASSNNLAGLGDMRVTGIIAGTSTFDEKSQIENGDGDIGTALESNTSSSGNCINQYYAISGADLLWDPGEFLYRDIDGSLSVSDGDLRMITVGTYGAGTTVIASDSDFGTPLKNGITNIACSKTNASYVYATNTAQILLSGQDDEGNKSFIRKISKNDIAGTSAINPLVFTQKMKPNVNIAGESATSCTIENFIITDNSECGVSGNMKEPQMEIYAFSDKIAYKIESTFSDFRIINMSSPNDCTLCDMLDIAGTAGTSTTYDNRADSESDITDNPTTGGPYSLRIQEYEAGVSDLTGAVATSDVNIPADYTHAKVAYLIQTALNNTSALKNNYSVSFRDKKYVITSTGITLTNPQTTLVSKGTSENFEQSIETSITDSSLVPIFGWYSVF